MNLSGVVTIQLANAEYINGEWVATDIVSEVTHHNDLRYRRLYEYFIDSYATYRSSSTSIDGNNYDMWISPDYVFGPVIEPSNKIEGIPVSLDEKPASAIEGSYWNFRFKWDPVSGGRTIRSLGIHVMTCVGLETPIVQTETQVLLVSYRLYNNDKPATATCYPWAVSSIARSFKFSTSRGPGNYYSYPRYLYCMPQSANNINIDKASFRALKLSQKAGESNFFIIPRAEEGILKRTANFTDLNTNNGELLGACYVGNIGAITSEPSPVRLEGQTCVQNTFSRNGSGTLEYLDIDALGTQTGSAIIDDLAGWTPAADHGLAEKYRVHITQSGDGNTAEYKFSRRVWSGTQTDTIPFRGRPYDLIKSIPTYESTNNQFAETLSGKQPHCYGVEVSNAWCYYDQPDKHDAGIVGTPYVQSYIFPEFITASTKGIMIAHTNKPYEVLDPYSDIPLPVTEIRQIEHTSDGTIYVACMTTGLWKIERTTLGTPEGSVSAITRVTASNAVDDRKCRGFQIKEDGTWWALFDLELCKSTDSGATWTVYNSTSTPVFDLGEYTTTSIIANRIVCMIVNRYSTNDEFIFPIADTGTGANATNSDFMWYSIQGSVSLGASDAEAGEVQSTASSGAPLNGRLTATKAYVAARNGEWYMASNRSVYRSTLHKYSGYKGTRTSLAGSNHTLYSTATLIGQAGAYPHLVDTPDGKQYLLAYGASTSTTPHAGNPAGGSRQYWVTAHNVSDGPLNVNIDTYDYIYGYAPTTYASISSTTGLNTWFMIGNATCVYPYYDRDTPYRKFWYAETFAGDELLQGESLDHWEHYGWNGSAWELNHPGSRSVHGTRQQLLDGLRISFTDEGAGSYVAGEYFDSYIYDGVLKDTATGLSYETEVFITNTFETDGFESGIVPSVSKGLITEPVTAMRVVNTEGSTFDTVFTITLGYVPIIAEPGRFGAGINAATSAECGLIGSQYLDGDYTITFNAVIPDKTYPTYPDWIGVRNWSDDPSAASTYDNPISECMDFRYNGSYNDVIIRVKSNNSIVHTETITDYELTDTFTIEQVSGFVSYKRNGVTFYTSINQRTSPQQFFIGSDGCPNFYFYNAEVTYTDSDLSLYSGTSGSGTGYYDTDFKKIITQGNAAKNANQIFLDGVEASLIYDSYTAPAPGQVLVKPYAGKLVFNAADSGKTITGKLTYVKILNVSNSQAVVDNSDHKVVTVAEGTNFWGIGPKFYFDGVMSDNVLVNDAYITFDQSDVTNTGYTLRVSKTPGGTNTIGAVEFVDRAIEGTAGNAGSLTRVQNTDPKLYYYGDAYGMGEPPIDQFYFSIDQVINVTVNGSVFALDGVDAPSLTVDRVAIKFDQSDVSNAGRTFTIANTADGTPLVPHVLHVGTPGTAGAYTIIDFSKMRYDVFYGAVEAAGYGNSIALSVFEPYFFAEYDAGNTTIADGSVNNVSITEYNTVSVSTTETLYEAASYEFTDGGAVELGIIKPWSQDHIFEFWLKPTINVSTFTNDRVIYDSKESYYTYGDIRLYVDSYKRLALYAGGYSYAVRSASDLLPVNEWTHIMQQRIGNDWSIWINGVRVITATYDQQHTTSTATLIVGNRSDRYTLGGVTGFYEGIKYTPSAIYGHTLYVDVPTKPIA